MTFSDKNLIGLNFTNFLDLQKTYLFILLRVAQLLVMQCSDDDIITKIPSRKSHPILRQRFLQEAHSCILVVERERALILNIYVTNAYES